MGTMDNTEIITFVTNNPGCTAQEIGVSPVEMTRLAAKGLVEKIGNRKTGTRGRPPVEWAVPGAAVAERESVAIRAIPNLPRMSAEIRKGLSPELVKQVAYIEAEFDTAPHGARENADYALLTQRYRKITKEAARRANAPVPVFDDEIIEEVEAA